MYIIEHNDASTRALYALVAREDVIRDETVSREHNEFHLYKNVFNVLIIQSVNHCEHTSREGILRDEEFSWLDTMKTHAVELEHFAESEEGRQALIREAETLALPIMDSEAFERLTVCRQFYLLQEEAERLEFENCEIQASVRISALSESLLDSHISRLTGRQLAARAESDSRRSVEESENEIREALQKSLDDGVSEIDYALKTASEFADRENVNRVEIMERARLLNEVRGMAFRQKLADVEREEGTLRLRISECEELVRSSKYFVFDQQNVFRSSIVLYYAAKDSLTDLYQSWALEWTERYFTLLQLASMEALEYVYTQESADSQYLTQIARELSAVEFAETMGRRLVLRELEDWWAGDDGACIGGKVSVERAAATERQIITDIFEEEQVGRWKVIAQERREWWGHDLRSVAPIPVSKTALPVPADTQPEENSTTTPVPSARNSCDAFVDHAAFDAALQQAFRTPPLTPLKPSRPPSSVASYNGSNGAVASAPRGPTGPRTSISLRRYYTKLNQWAHVEGDTRERFYAELRAAGSPIHPSLINSRPFTAGASVTVSSCAAAPLTEERRQSSTTTTAFTPKKPSAALRPKLRVAAVENDEEATRTHLQAAEGSEVHNMAYHLTFAKEQEALNRPLTWADIDALCRR